MAFPFLRIFMLGCYFPPPFPFVFYRFLRRFVPLSIRSIFSSCFCLAKRSLSLSLLFLSPSLSLSFTPSFISPRSFSLSSPISLTSFLFLSVLPILQSFPPSACLPLSAAYPDSCAPMSHQILSIKLVCAAF